MVAINYTSTLLDDFFFLLVMLKKRNVVGVESGVLVQYQECFGIKQ